MGGPAWITPQEVAKTRGWPLPLRVKQLAAARHVVVDAEGRRRTGIVHHEELAQEMAFRLERAARARMTTCMNPACRADMVTEGPHNRLCLNCRQDKGRSKATFEQRAAGMGYGDDPPPPRITLPALPENW